MTEDVKALQARVAELEHERDAALERYESAMHRLAELECERDAWQDEHDMWRDGFMVTKERADMWRDGWDAEGGDDE